jgi:hypothetical protein
MAISFSQGKGEYVDGILDRFFFCTRLYSVCHLNVKLEKEMANLQFFLLDCSKGIN